MYSFFFETHIKRLGNLNLHDTVIEQKIFADAHRLGFSQVMIFLT